MPIDPDKIRARRDKLGMTQDDAARKANMPRPHWARLESGERDDPKLSTAERVAKALRCALQRLLR